MTCINPTSKRNNNVNVALTNPVNSAHVAETYEFRRRLKELLEEVQIRVDGTLDRYFQKTAGT
jgi:hypothetical protein